MSALSRHRASLRASVSVLALLCAPAALAAEAAPEMPEVVISTGKETAETPVQGYRAKRSASATKTDTALIDTPQSVTVVPKDVLQDVGGHTADKALEYVPGTAKGNTFGGLNTYDSIIRGFRSSISARNGFTAGRRYDASTDAANVERVEVLLGPSAQTYGRSDPGGIYNIVTKKPQPETFIDTKVELGSYDFYRGSVDANAAVTADKNILARLNFAYEDKNSFRDYVSSSRQVLAPVISWQGSGDTRVILEGEMLHDARTFDRGVVAVRGDVKAMSRNTFLGLPGDGPVNMDTLFGSLRVEHDINQDWTLRLQVMGKNGSMYGYATQYRNASSLQADNQTLLRKTQFRNYYWTAGNTQLEAVGHFSTFGIRHTLLTGTELELSRSTERLYSGNTTSVNIWAPSYDFTRPKMTTASNLFDSTTKYGLYVQDQIDLTQSLQIQLGGRWDGYDQHDQQRDPTIVPFGRQMNQSKGAFSPRAGVLYKLVPSVALFANISKSFNKNPDVPATDSSGTMIQPETGLGYEGGIKTDLLDDQLSITTSIYHIVKNNVSVTDPNNSNYALTSGKVRSQGFDLNVTGNITPEWKLIGGFAYVDASILQDPLTPRGSNLQNVPMMSAPLFTVYEFLSGELEGLGFGGGATYVGKRAVADGSTIHLPEYAKIDLLAYYKLGDRAKVSLNVNNLLNKGYYSSALGATAIMPGEPMSVMGSVSVKF
jgi:iron complex outermembrane receptor protein